jgi:hypothetical protein
MTDYKETTAHWAASRSDWTKADTEAIYGDPAFCCILELRNRVEALEASVNKLSSLMEQTLIALDQIESEYPTGSFGDAIRRAINALPK